jgi:hypothetical protein
VGIPHHHDRDDDILLFDDEKARNGLLDGLLHKRQQGSPKRWITNRRLHLEMILIKKIY